MGRKNYSDGTQNTAYEFVLGNPAAGAVLATGASNPLNCQDIYTLASAQISFPSAPASISVNLEGSLDGVNWTVLQTSTAVTTNTISSVGTQFRLLRLNVTAFAGGSSPTIIGIVTAQPGSTLGGTADLQTILAATGSIAATTTLNATTSANPGTTVDFGHAVQEIAFSIVATGTVTAGQVTMQVSSDNVNWNVPPTAAFTNNSAATLANPYVLVTNTGALFTLNFAGVRYARCNVSTAVTGGATVSATISGA